MVTFEQPSVEEYPEEKANKVYGDNNVIQALAPKQFAEEPAFRFLALIR